MKKKNDFFFIPQVARTIGLLSAETTEASSPSLYSGYLWRQSGHTSQNNQKWVRRYFCLRPDHCLYYYKTDQVKYHFFFFCFFSPSNTLFLLHFLKIPIKHFMLGCSAGWCCTIDKPHR